MSTWRRWQDYATMVLGVILFVTPSVFGDTGQTTAAISAYVLGVLVFLSGCSRRSCERPATSSTSRSCCP